MNVGRGTAWVLSSCGVAVWLSGSEVKDFYARLHYNNSENTYVGYWSLCTESKLSTRGNYSYLFWTFCFCLNGAISVEPTIWSDKKWPKYIGLLIAVAMCSEGVLSPYLSILSDYWCWKCQYSWFWMYHMLLHTGIVTENKRNIKQSARRQWTIFQTFNETVLLAHGSTCAAIRTDHTWLWWDLMRCSEIPHAL